MPIETIKIEQDRILVVEGKEETLFFSALITQLGLHGIQILPVGGKTNLRPNLKALRNAAGFDRVISLGLVRDADNDPVAAFQSVRSALTAVNLNAPTQVGTPSG